MPRYVSAAAYEVRKPDGSVAGRIIRGVYLEASASHADGFNPYYAGTVITDDQGRRVLYLGISGAAGVIEGHTLTLNSGETWKLEPLLGKGSRIEEPEGFRLLLEQMQLAEDAGDAERVRRMRYKFEASAWQICPTCQDRFADRDDCPTCNGKGIVYDP